VRRIRPSGEKPFSNFTKYEAMSEGTNGSSIYLASSGPYISRLEQRRRDEMALVAKSIHSIAFKPGGKWHYPAGETKQWRPTVTPS
jgi:hypothetical protein